MRVPADRLSRDLTRIRSATQHFEANRCSSWAPNKVLGCLRRLVTRKARQHTRCRMERLPSRYKCYRKDTSASVALENRWTSTATRAIPTAAKRTLRTAGSKVTCALANGLNTPEKDACGECTIKQVHNLIMKKFSLICIFAALAASLSSCANGSFGQSTATQQEDVFRPPTEPPPMHDVR